MTDKMLAAYNNSETDGQLREDLTTEPVVLLFHRLASSARKPSGVEWKELFAMMGRRTAPVIRLLHDSGDGLTFNEQCVCLLVSLHFTPSEMGTLTGVSPQGISNMRSRLMWKLFRAGGGARDFDARLQTLK
ncbi:MAG: Tetratricopeptide repeat protein [bacterium P3]|nr:MAG: Tetratricopeptide repeat protein [bacterium P3]KWW27893.1 MAG: Tetratricopeptide repeat protein [bacterium F083]